MENNAREQGNVLAAIDDSTATWKALGYVADLAKRNQEVSIHLLHAAVYPPALQESRGAENPKDEEQVEKDLEREQQRWQREAERAAAPLFARARAALENAGTAPERIQSHTATLAHREELIDEIVQAAHEFHCGTVVVGRSSFPWLKELFADHLGEEISDRASDISVKVVE